MMAAHFHFWYSIKEVSWNFCQFGSQIFPMITSYKNLVQFFSVGFKNQTGFAEAICKNAKSAPSFEITKSEFERKRLN